MVEDWQALPRSLGKLDYVASSNPPDALVVELDYRIVDTKKVSVVSRECHDAFDRPEDFISNVRHLEMSPGPAELRNEAVMVQR